MKITANGKYPFEYFAEKVKILQRGKKYVLGEVEVAVPEKVVIKEIPVNPTRELCASLYPPTPIPQPEPQPEPIPEPIPEPSGDEPKPNWDDGWPMIETHGKRVWEVLNDRSIYPSITKPVDKARLIAYVFHEDAEIPWADCNWMGPYTENDYGYSIVPPLFEVEKFYDYVSKWVPMGLPNGPRDSKEVAFLAHSYLRFHIGNAASFYCYGKVSWSDEVPHGFNMVIAYPDAINVHDWYLYLFDLTNRVPVTLVKKDDPYKIINFFGYDIG